VGHASVTSTVSDLNKKIYGTIEAWRNRPIEGEHPYVYLDGIVLKRSWAGEVRNVSLLVAIGVNEHGYQEILGICEGAKEDKTGWSAFLKHLKERGLKGIRLITSDACIGLAESAAEFFPEAAWQRCIVGSLKKSPAADSVLVNDSLLAGAGYARAQGAGSTGALHHGVAQAAHSGTGTRRRRAQPVVAPRRSLRLLLP